MITSALVSNSNYILVYCYASAVITQTSFHLLHNCVGLLYTLCSRKAAARGRGGEGVLPCPPRPLLKLLAGGVTFWPSGGSLVSHPQERRGGWTDRAGAAEKKLPASLDGGLLGPDSAGRTETGASCKPGQVRPDSASKRRQEAVKADDGHFPTTTWG